MVFFSTLVFMTGLKSPKEYLHDVLQKWGKGADLENAPSKWTGVTCAGIIYT